MAENVDAAQTRLEQQALRNVRGLVDNTETADGIADATARRLAFGVVVFVAILSVGLLIGISQSGQSLRADQGVVPAGRPSPALRSYLDSWRQRIETVGSLNMPPNTYGRVRLTVAVRANGALGGVEIDQSSGTPALDAAAVRIAHLAAPYRTFPSEMANTDLLYISRTWRFERDGTVKLRE
jgi:TonB family protein